MSTELDRDTLMNINKRKLLFGKLSEKWKWKSFFTGSWILLMSREIDRDTLIRVNYYMENNQKNESEVVSLL